MIVADPVVISGSLNERQSKCDAGIARHGVGFAARHVSGLIEAHPKVLGECRQTDQGSGKDSGSQGAFHDDLLSGL